MPPLEIHYFLTFRDPIVSIVSVARYGKVGYFDVSIVDAPVVGIKPEVQAAERGGRLGHVGNLVGDFERNFGIKVSHNEQ